MQFVQCLWLEIFETKDFRATLKTPKTDAMEIKVCHVIKLRPSFQKKLNSRRSVQEENGFQKGAQCAPPGPQEIKKSLAWIGLIHV